MKVFIKKSLFDNIKKNFIVLILIFCMSINAFADSSIIYAPTAATTTSELNDTNVVEPASVVTEIFAAEDSTKVDYITVYSIYEDNGNYYCNDKDGTLAKNCFRKISKHSYAEFAPIDNFPYDYIWAYFSSSGKAVKASTGNIKKTKIGNETYAFNEYGQLLQGFFNDSAEMWNEYESEDPFDLLSDKNYLYHADENTGALTSGWYKLSASSRYENKNVLWLYFNPTNFRSVRTTNNNYKSQVINSKTYAFDDNGVMLVGFEAMEYNANHGGNTSKYVYFSTDGAEVSDKFVSIDLSDDLNTEIYGDPDEDITIYLNKSGKLYYNCIKKIGNYYYGFSNNGALIKGLSVWQNGEYIATIDTEATDGKAFIMSGKYVSKNGGTGYVGSYTLQYFDDTGKRKTSVQNLEFADDVYSYYASNSGAYNGVYNKKYYSNGVLLKATSGCKYGIYLIGGNGNTYTFSQVAGNTNAIVLNSTGARVSSNSGQKDENDNYWLFSSSNNGYLVNIYSCNVKVSNGKYYFKGANANGSDIWYEFGEKDANNRTCVANVVANGTRLANGAIASYQVTPYQNSAINFYLKK